jgi:histidyl-tRNA synthetase
MTFQAVKGTRDFYPESMRLRNWIVDAWRRVSLRNGFEEYDAPIFEYLDLFTVKSGDEIAEQLFSFTDRGGRNLAIRPEITPSLGRMVTAKINALPRPIKWFSVPRLCRAENPQKGRLREFFQWNIDIIGTDSVLADVECVFVAVDLLAELGLSSDDVEVRIGSRQLTTAFLRQMGIGEDRMEAVLALLDKRPKVDADAFAKMAGEQGLDGGQVEAICRFQDAENLQQAADAIGDADAVAEPLERLREFFSYLEPMGIADYCRLDLRIVRGLAYYTGIVYEVFDKSQSLRAVAGGGRYDNLTQVLGGPKVGATGFGMGDVVLGILLEEKGKLPNLAEQLDFFVVEDGETCRPAVLYLTGELRRRGWSADYSFKGGKTSKQLKEANRRGAGLAVFVSVDENAVSRDGNLLRVKNLRNGKQVPVNLFLGEFLDRPEINNVRGLEQLLARLELDGD